MTERINAAAQSPSEAGDVLTDILRDGARRLLAQAIDAEVQDWINGHAHLVDENSRRLVVRNGHSPEREIVTGLGPVPVRQPRVRDKRPLGEREVFSSKLLPPYLRKTKTVEEFLPWLYLKGVSTGGFQEALASLLGPECPGLSASTITRLKSVWEGEHEEWSRRSLKGKRYVYVWADGIYSNIRLEGDRQCILVLMGATEGGTKELIALSDGFRESEESWKELMLDLKSRGLEYAPELAVGDGALGFWPALRKVWPTTQEQRCTVHKTANVLGKLPKSLHPQGKRMLHAIWDAPTKAEADRAFDLFLKTFDAKYPKVIECLAKDRGELLTFYSFPAEHWGHIRTTNPIESTFATIRLRHRKTKGNDTARACVAMMFKLAESASKTWRTLRGYRRIPDVIHGVEFEDGISKNSPPKAAAV